MEQLGLFDVGLGLEPAEGVEVGHVADVVLLQEPSDRVLGGHPALDEAEPRPEHVAERPHLVGDHVGLRQEIGPQKMGQHLRVRAVRLDFGGAMALTPFAWASVRSTWSASASWTQYHPVVHSTVAAWSPGLWAK